MIKKHYTALFWGLLLFWALAPFKAFGQDTDIPEKTSRLVNDYAGFLSSDENNALEQKLVAYSDSTSCQIAVIIVKSLNGYDISDLATRIGKKWGIGEAGKNNGVLILVKPKTREENGKAWIATGYGAESTVPDVLCKRIVDNEIIPSFKAGQNYQGLDKATTVIYSCLRGEYTPSQYIAKHKSKKNNSPVALIILIVVAVIIISSIKRGSSNQQHLSSGSSLPFWMLMGMMGSGGNRGSFGDFNSGGGAFGGGDSGGFGGFGGGDFGGGGAGGSW
jgi:uncharacterized protein